MHIAMLIGALHKGGAERVLVNLANHFVMQGHTVTMVTQYRAENEYPLDQRIKRVLSDITEEETTDSRVRNFVKRVTKLRGIWKKEQPDVILSFIGKNNMMAVMTSRFLDIPVAVSVRADPKEEYNTSLMRSLAGFLFARTEGVILQTRQSVSFFPKKVQKKAVILKNPIHESFFRKRWSGKREKTIVAVGRVDANKNHEMLIRAFAGLAEEFPEYNLIIYGEGELRNSLCSLVQELHLEERIQLPGSIDNVADKICKSSIFVLPSNTEGTPNTLIEAMLMGLACISTDCPCGGPADLIRDGENGILTPVGDVEKLKEHLRYLMEHPDQIEKIGENAALLSGAFAEEKVYGEWEAYLSGLINRK